MKLPWMVLLSAAVLSAQPAFDVISVKASSGAPNDPPQLANGRLHDRNVNVKTLIRMAYQMPDFQISGDPKWLTSDLYDIDAKSEAAANTEQTRLMLQDLLADRFHLKVHKDTKELPAYALVVANGKTHKLTPADGTGCEPEPSRTNPCQRIQSAPGFVMSGQKVSMPMFCKLLGSLFGSTVIDKTSLDGVFDFKLDLGRAGFTSIPGSPTNEMEGLNAVTAGLQEQLGLKLEKTKTSTEILVIEHVEKPSEN